MRQSNSTVSPQQQYQLIAVSMGVRGGEGRGGEVIPKWSYLLQYFHVIIIAESLAKYLKVEAYFVV